MFGVSNSLLAFSAAVAALVFGVFKLVRARLFFRHLVSLSHRASIS